MPLVTSTKMLKDAQKGNYAVGAFNAENMEMVKAIIQAAEELKAPVMIQTTPSTIKYGTLETYVAMVSAEAEKAAVPVCLHLDHGNSFELAVQAMKAGYTSVMIDGSHEDFEGNIAVTKKVADVANALGIPVEAELGKVGGKEDDLEADADTNTDPEEAKEFVERTGVNSLAVAIGTAHGIYPAGMKPELRQDLLSEIKSRVSIPLVLHGGSGNADSEIAEAVKRGINKINISSDIKDALYQRLRITLKDPKIREPFELYPDSVKAMNEVVAEKIRLFQDDDKAKYYTLLV